MGDTAKNIVWLASYPKSGNTWIRILLSNYLNPSVSGININEIDSSIISSSRTILDNYLPYLSSDLSFEEIDNIRPLLYQEISKETEELQYIKTHDAFTLNKNKEAIFPPAISKAVIHIVRNPLDVAVSFAYHSDISIDKSIEALNNSDKCLAKNKNALNKQLRQKLLSWSEHYRSWKNADLPYHLVKYEDLLNHPESTFEKLILFLYGQADKEQIKKAVKLSSFEKLKKQEHQTPFREKPLNAKTFFRRGKSNSWEKEMTTKQVEKIINSNHELMKILEYLNN